MAITSLVAAVCGLLAQPVLGALVVALLTGKNRNPAVGQTIMHVAFILPPMLGVVASLLAWSALRRIKANPPGVGKGLAVAGLVIGLATLAYTASTWFVAVVGSHAMKDF